jgi:hypothetical protein
MKTEVSQAHFANHRWAGWILAKYNQLVADMVILHNNVHQMTKLLKGIQAKGYVLTEEVLRGLAPYRKGHINRCGEYMLEREVVPMNYKVEFF